MIDNQSPTGYSGPGIPPKKEQVEHPTHYNVGIEVWDYTTSHNLDFLEGNVVKYVTRWRHKNGMQDLYKAKQYLDKLIEVNEGK